MGVLGFLGNINVEEQKILFNQFVLVGIYINAGTQWIGVRDGGMDIGLGGCKVKKFMMQNTGIFSLVYSYLGERCWVGFVDS